MKNVVFLLVATLTGCTIIIDNTLENTNSNTEQEDSVEYDTVALDNAFNFCFSYQMINTCFVWYDANWDQYHTNLFGTYTSFVQQQENVYEAFCVQMAENAQQNNCLSEFSDYYQCRMNLCEINFCSTTSRFSGCSGCAEEYQTYTICLNR
jgi:hypothetical protein